MAIDPALAAVAGALVTVSVTFFGFLRLVLKRSWDREDKRDAQFDRLADLIEQALGIKVERR